MSEDAEDEGLGASTDSRGRLGEEEDGITLAEAACSFDSETAFERLGERFG